ncbi:MAG: hypothetical protein JWR12_2228 [Mucilaginibacter sp.]|nr:hypothetical protein [Mucilaginibacter sp.]
MSLRPPIIEALRQETADFTKRKIKAGQFGTPFGLPEYELLQTHPANYFMKLEHSKPMPRMLFGSLWFERELCILFADTNLGKSVLAVQIADSITKAYTIGPFSNQADECPKVLYVDFELSGKQFQMRYYDPKWGSYLFSEQFFRAQFNPLGDDPVIHNNKYEDYIKMAIGKAVKASQASVLIIDNITYMCRGTEKAKDATPLMKMLKALKTKHNLSVLVLAHTPKRNPHKPLTVNDLQGSKMLINFADSAFAIGQSSVNPATRYIKQIKQRSAREEYGETNVCLITQEMKLNFLQYNFIGYDHEQNHLHRPIPTDTALLRQQVRTLHQQGHSNRHIGRRLGIHHATVAGILEKGPENES